jgi:DNA-binding transcriptional ArsR family regulator
VASADLLLHPIRLRIVQTFLGRGELTTTELRAELPDIAVATLYRQVTALLDGGVLEVADERKIRGALERTLVLQTANASVTGKDSATMSIDEHRRAFLTFVAGLLHDFDRYLSRGDIDLVRDLVGYRQAVAHLSNSEMHELLAELRAVIEPRLQNPAAPDRTRRMITTILMPAMETL